MNFVLSLVILTSMFALNSAIVSTSSFATSSPENVKKEKRGIYGVGVHGNRHHYEDLSFLPNHYHAHVPPPLGSPPQPAPVNLGAHFHTTVTKKIAIPIPYPYPVKVPVPIYKPYPVPVDRPVPVPHYVPHPYVINPHSPPVGPLPTHHHHSHHPWQTLRW